MILGGFNVTFQYDDDGKSTACVIKKQKEDEEPLSEVKIRLYFKDKPWEKERLRKEILKMTLQNTSLTKEERTAIWEDYRLSRPTPRWGTKG